MVKGIYIFNLVFAEAMVDAHTGLSPHEHLADPVSLSCHAVDITRCEPVPRAVLADTLDASPRRSSAAIAS